MKVLVAGSREYGDYKYLTYILDNHNMRGEVSEIVSGMARGVDMMGWNWAFDRGIPRAEFPADWDKHGRAAGYIRNKEMGDYADELVAFWDGKSRGTKHMINYMTSLDKPVTVYRIGVVEEMAQ